MNAKICILGIGLMILLTAATIVLLSKRQQTSQHPDSVLSNIKAEGVTPETNPSTDQQGAERPVDGYIDIESSANSKVSQVRIVPPRAIPSVLDGRVQDSSPGGSLLSNDIDALNGRSGTLADVLAALNMKTDLTSAATLLDLKLQEECRVSVEESSTGRIKLELNDDREFSFRKDVKELVGYSDFRVENIPPTLTHEDAVDPEQTRRAAQEFLTILGLDYDLSNTPYEFMDSHNQHDLFGARWEFRVIDEHQGFQVTGQMLVAVSAYSGNVVMLVRTPVIIPENMEVRVDEKGALASVARFAENQGLRIGSAAVTHKWIVPPTTVWKKDLKKKTLPDRENPRPVYEVFAVDAAKSREPADYENAYYYFFYVDCYTSEIIGGGGRDSSRIAPSFAEIFESRLSGH